MDAHGGSRTIRLAPDWLPNTNHLGFYAALALGYYAEESLVVEILPFDGEAMPNRKIVSGETDFGLMPHQSIISMRARGVDVVSVAALVQPNTTTLAVRAASGIERPAQLAGKRYASFGTEFEVPMVEHLIRHDDGTGTPVLVNAEKLDILQALYDSEIDMAWGFYAWEGLQAELAGQQLRHFFVAEHGVPNEYFPLLFTSRALTEREPERVRAFVRATGRGYRFAVEQPDTAAEYFLRQVPAEVLPAQSEELVRRSARWLAPRFAQLADPSAPWGWHDAEQWHAFAAFIRQLAQKYGLTPPEPNAESSGYSNAFLA